MPTPPFWRDDRFWRIFGQVIAVCAIVMILLFFWRNLTANLEQLGIRLGFRFLGTQAGFQIAERPISYQPSSSYARALLVGLVNSLKVIGVGMGLATIVGLTAGIARLSDNWLVRQLALVYVEAFRNTPLLLQLFFWYFAVFLALPKAEAAIDLGGFITLSNQGITLPFSLQFSSEFCALLLGLTFSTAAFIAEIVRGGIQAVPNGQWEAAQSLGLNPGQRMRLVIFPQALRIIIPSMTGQYLNLAKNSSLAVAIGYRDLYAVSATMENQTGRAVEAMLLIMATYLTISLVIALLTNLYNQRVQIVER